MVVVITAGDFDDEDYDALLGMVDDYMLRVYSTRFPWTVDW
jgi:hypothetical protein